MTLNGHFALCFKIHAFLEPTTKIWMKIDPSYQRQRCSAMTVVSGNIRFMPIFAGVPWRRGVRVVKRQCRIFTDLKMHDLEWPRMAILVKFLLYEHRFQKLFYILTVERIYRTFLLYHVTSRDVRSGRDPQNISDPRKDCGSFVEEKLRALHRRNLNK